jgi:hypothetical protein
METTLLNTLEFDDRFSIEFLYRKDKNPLRVRLTLSNGSGDSEESFELPMDTLTAYAREAIRKCAGMAVEDCVQSLAVQ